MIREIKEPQVVLLAHTNMEIVSSKAAQFCTSSSTVDEIMEPRDNDEAVLRRVLNMGHLSVLEHFSATFGISGISRVTEVQLVRHRVASYSIKSGRYTTLGDDYEVVIPKSLVGTSYRTFVEMAHQLYKNAVKNGVPAEDARYLLPQATATQAMVTMNARELLHFFGERCCTCAQWEIRGVANKMLNICQTQFPSLFVGAGAKCLRDNVCREWHTKWCGKAPHYQQVT